MQHPIKRTIKLPVFLSVLVLVILAIVVYRHATDPASTRALSGRSASQPPAYRNRAVLAPNAEMRPSGDNAERPKIEGYVYDSLGNTLSGATLTATTFEIAGNVPTVVGSVSSDESGRFSFDLNEGSYQINVTHKGYGPGSVTAHSGDVVSVVLTKAGSVKGRVLNQKSEPLTHFNVDIINYVPSDMPAPPPVFSRAFDSPDGSYLVDEVPPWPFLIRISADNFAPTFSSRLKVPPGETRELDLMLTAGCVVAGRVKNKKGEGVPNVFVDAEEQRSAGTMSALSMQTANQVQSEADGGFRLENVPVGTVVIRGYDGSNAVTSATIELKSCENTQPVDLVLSPGGSLAGVTRRGDGSPLPGARVSLTNRAIGIINTVSDSAGRYRFDEIPEGSVRLEMEYKGHRKFLFTTVKEADTVTQDISLYAEGTATLEGQVTAAGKPLAGARLMIAANYGRDQGIDTYYPTTGKDGRYRLSSLPPGNYLITMVSAIPSQRTQLKEGESVTVDLDVGERPQPNGTN